MDLPNLIALKHAIARLQQIFKRCGFGNIRIDIDNMPFPNTRTANEWVVEARRRTFINYPLDVNGEVLDTLQDCIENEYNMYLDDLVENVFGDIAMYKLGLPDV